ncbi:MAG: lipoyl(octanoyl) transferase LipB [Thermoanaerobaculia bacterium]
MPVSLEWRFLGRVPYLEAAALQEATRESVRGGGPDTLLLLEHPHVYTLGRNADPAEIRTARAALAARGIEVAATDRGGKVTYHGPGQLVGYPIVDLSRLDRRDVRSYVRDLQETLVRTLADYGLAAEARDRPETGVWVTGKKIASLGVHIQRWVTTHGFALNVTTDLSYFAGIVPCGLDGVEMASIESLTGRRPPLGEVAGQVAAHLGTVFGHFLPRAAPERSDSRAG